MPDQLDILAFEPFYGGFRREMLETLTRNSRHRWKILKLPPRRLDRRLTTAARWFTEQMHRHGVGHFDVLFSSEALNLADLFRLMPELSRKPAVVYFHSHQLGDGRRAPDSAHDYANLNAAAAATELWFISKFGRRDFFATAQALIARDAELSTQDVLPALTVKARIVPPPVEFDMDRNASPTIRQNRIIVNTEDADVELLQAALNILRRRKIPIRFIAIGSIDKLSQITDMEPVSRTNPADVTGAFVQSDIYLSVSPNRVFDELAVRAMGLQMNVVLPRAGGYVELMTPGEPSKKLYAVDPESLANAVQQTLTATHGTAANEKTMGNLVAFRPLEATKSIDNRFAELARMAD